MTKAGGLLYGFNDLRVVQNNTLTSVARIMPSNRGAAHLLSARLEDGVELGAVLEDFPGAFEPGRYDECLTGREFPALAVPVLEDDAPLRQAAELRLGIADAPLA